MLIWGDISLLSFISLNGEYVLGSVQVNVAPAPAGGPAVAGGGQAAPGAVVAPQAQGPAAPAVAGQGELMMTGA